MDSGKNDIRVDFTFATCVRYDANIEVYRATCSLDSSSCVWYRCKTSINTTARIDSSNAMTVLYELEARIDARAAL